MNSDFTFVFDNDGKAHAMKEGKVVASANSVEELETLVKNAAQPFDGVVGEVGAGAAGADVNRIQQGLGINADGQFGAQTEQAVKDFQQDNNLAVDGIVGPDTSKAMADFAASKASDQNTHFKKSEPAPVLDQADQAAQQAQPFTPPEAGSFLQNTQPSPSTIPPSGFEAPSLLDPSKPKMPNGVPPTPQPSAPGGALNKGMGQNIFGSKEAKESATHVITPNGLKGRILGKTKDMWGDTVTVRFENGRIVQFPTSDSLRYASEQEEVLSVTASLRERLNAPIEGDSESLVSRINELKSIRREAQVKIANGDASFEDESELDNIAVEADAELGQVVAALDHINDENTDAYRPPTMHVAEQASLGGNDGTWLDDAFSTMVSEASSTDYDKLMSEGPEAFVAELDTAALANAGATREIASSHIRSKTAGANPQARNSFETAWIDRVETLRRKEILNRKTKAKKEAAAETDHSNLPDDILFG